MGNIRILPDNIINKIAAGEVVARPSSVVKELIDNAIDAHATSIEVCIEDGGKKKITVVDDGCGMDANDAKLATVKHATSKIVKEEDLKRINTMGFRGEALCAIASVSDLIIQTKPKDPCILEGTKVHVKGGVLKDISVCGCPAGTSVIVSDLFFNTPARRKFLRSDSVEFGHIMEIVSSIALSHPHIRFELTCNGVSKLVCRKTELYEDRIADVLGSEVIDLLREIDEKGEGISLKGFVVRDVLRRATAKDIHIFINRRSVKDKIVQHALMAGFDQFLAQGEYPIAVLYLDVDPFLVDVNVHPMKSEVRFAKGAMIHDFVKYAVRKAILKDYGNLIGKTKVESVTFETKGSIESFNKTDFDSSADLSLPAIQVQYGKADGLLQTTCGLKILGQFGKTYIVCEDTDQNLVLIDQHAAHERIGYELLKNKTRQKAVESQRLILLERIELTPKETTLIAENLDILSRSGFEVELYSGNSLIVRAVPSMLSGSSLKFFFEKLAYELEHFESSLSAEDALDRVLKLIACHTQVRGGDHLSFEEMRALVQDIFRYDVSHCPHGRPVIVKVKKEDIEKWFKRA